MKRLALLASTLLLTAAVLTSCVTPQARLTEADMALRRINEERMRNYQQPSHVPGLTNAELALKQAKDAREQQHQDQLGYESATVTKPGPSVREVITAIVALPIVLPLAAMVEYGHHGTSVHCHSWTYKDAYHASCY